MLPITTTTNQSLLYYFIIQRHIFLTLYQNAYIYVYYNGSLMCPSLLGDFNPTALHPLRNLKERKIIDIHKRKSNLFFIFHNQKVW